MYLNIEKCKIMRAGKRTPKKQYTMVEPITGVPKKLEEYTEKDLES